MSTHELFRSGKYSDFRIKCKTQEWGVHRAIICPQSGYFAALCDGNFKEVAAGEVDVSTEDPNLIEQMLKYLYTGDYDQTPPDDFAALTDRVANINTAPDDSLQPAQRLSFMELDSSLSPSFSSMEMMIAKQQRNISMYAIGDRYLIEGLKSKASLRFWNELPASWSPEYWVLVDEISEQTAATDETLRNPIIELWLSDGMKLLADNEFCKELKEYPDLEVRLLRRHCANLHAQVQNLEPLVGRVYSLNTQLNESERKRKELKESFAEKVERFNKIRECRHCGEDFPFLFETTASSYDINITLRCRDCRTKHK
ncbi:hypothetical protein ABW19_dt0205801 [Dactylella cylindrospora]|nr:hypothetical protein ABW19_dt0205801 [Dactylella cylindrospora]